EMWSAMRRQANGWAMGHAAPKPILFPDAQGPVLPEGNNNPLRERLGEEGMGFGGVLDHATDDDDRPLPSEPPPSPRPIPPAPPRTNPCPPIAWHPSPNRGPSGAHASSAIKAQKKPRQRGRPPARGTGAVAAGGRESEGCLRGWTLGNRGSPGPSRAKAARVEVIFRRDPGPTP